MIPATLRRYASVHSGVPYWATTVPSGSRTACVSLAPTMNTMTSGSSVVTSSLVRAPQLK